MKTTRASEKFWNSCGRKLKPNQKPVEFTNGVAMYLESQTERSAAYMAGRV